MPAKQPATLSLEGDQVAKQCGCSVARIETKKAAAINLASRLASGSTKADEALRSERQTVLTTPQGSTTGDVRLRHKGYKHFVHERRTGDNVTSMDQVMRTT